MTPLQMIKSKGFKELSRSRQTSNKYWCYGIIKDGVVVARAGLEVGSYERNPMTVMVDVAGKLKTIHCDWGTNGPKRFDEAKMQRLEQLLNDSIAAGPKPTKPAKPRPTSPMKGKTLSDAQKADNRVWRRLGELTCIGFVDKDMQTRMNYIRGPKFIRLEDWDCIMAYANIREHDLEGLGMSLKDLEAFLISKGVKRKAQKRMKPSFSLYD